jgi:carbonic anhydrase
MKGIADPMDDLHHLLNGAAEFNRAESKPVKPLLERLGREGQSPDALFITCADSRIDPSLIMQSQPGDLFILRNIGNLVPEAQSGDFSVMASVEYALEALGVQTIVICGHSDCGAMKVAHSGADLSAMPHAKEWLDNAQPSLRAFDSGETHVSVDDDLPAHDCLSQINVVTQFENLLTYPAVRKAVENEKLRLVGMWFDIANAEVLVYDNRQHKFVAVDRAMVAEHKANPRTAMAAALGSAVAVAVWDGGLDVAITAANMMGL